MKIAYIPQDAPFNEDQRAWISGFLAGLHSRLAMNMAPPPPVLADAPASRPALRILFGTQTGNAEGVANDAAAAAKAQGFEIITGQFPFAANGRSLTAEAGEDGGFVRVTARADNHLVLGIHAVGKHVSELSGEFVHAIEMGARLEDIAGTIHQHPTMTEALPEAALGALGHAIHI